MATTFEIIRKGSIPSNDAEHKVTIGQIQLVPELSYEAIPSVSSNAFQMAKVKNTSVYTFLPGPSSMFYDNNFVAQGQMRALYPQEEFTCYFGIDPAICILYKPPKIFTEELNEWFCRTKEAKVTTERFIQVRNNKSDAVRIKLIENIPRSTDEKIQVSLTNFLL